MRVVRKPIEVVAKFNIQGQPIPMKFRLLNEEESWTEVKIDRIITTELERLAGNKMLIFNCQSKINNLEKVYQLKYELDSCKWMLFKI